MTKDESIGLGKDNKDDEISFYDLLAFFLRHKVRISIITLCAAILSIGYSIGSLLLSSEKSYLPNLYKPSATMLVNNPDSGGGLSSVLASSGLSSLAGMAGISAGGANYGLLAVLMARSNTIVDALVEKFDLVNRYKIHKSPKATSRKTMLQHYSAVYDEKTGILTLSFEDRDPEMARDLVNHAVGLLGDRFTSIGGNRNVLKKYQLESKLADVMAEMTRIESNIQDFQQKHGVVTIESIATEQVSTVARIRSELIMKEMEIKTYGDISNVQDPVYARLKAERNNLFKLLEELEKGFSEYEKTLPTQRELPRLAIEFRHLQRDLLIQEKIFELLTQQYELTKLQIAGTDPIIQIIETAEVPDIKSSPSRGTICIIVTLAGLFLAIIWAFISEVIKKAKTDTVVVDKLRTAAK